MNELVKRYARVSSADLLVGRYRNVEAAYTIIQEFAPNSGVYAVDALTIDQSWLRLLCIEMPEEERELFLALLQQYEQTVPMWTTPRSPTILSYTPPARYTQSRPVALSVSTAQETTEVSDPHWVDSADTLLSRLEGDSTTDAERRIAILAAETTAFDEQAKQRLLSALATFITRNRFTTDDDTITVLGSAIRKYAMNMDESDFDTYAHWLQPTATETLHHHVELELAKGASWRLAYEPTGVGDRLAQLKTALVGLAGEYTSARLILQKNYASIVLHAVVGVAILEALTAEDRETERLLKQASELRMDWFCELLQRRIADACKAIEKRDPALANVVGEVAMLGKNA